MLRRGLITVLLLASCFAHSQTLPYGAQRVQMAQTPTATVAAYISGFNNPTNGGLSKLSGTNVEFIINAITSFDASSIFGSNQHFVASKVKSIELTANVGSTSYPIEIKQPVDPNQQYPLENKVISKRIRIQSTKFPHDATITFTLKVVGTFRVQDNDPQGSNGANVDSQECVTTVQAKIYNCALVYHTQVNLVDGLWVNDDGSPDYASCAKAGAEKAQVQLGAMNHLSVGNTILHYKSQLVDSTNPTFEIPTVALIFTHSTSTGGDAIVDSGLVGSSSHPLDAMQFNPQISIAVRHRATGPNGILAPYDNPVPNIVLMYACSMGANKVSWRDTFMMQSGNTSLPDKGYAGFKFIVYYGVWENNKQDIPFTKVKENPPDSRLYDHMELVLGELAAGFTLSESIDEANKQFPPRTLIGSTMKYQAMLYNDVDFGDDVDTVLMRVYFTLADRNDLSDDTGYETPQITAQTRPSWYFTRRAPDYSGALIP